MDDMAYRSRCSAALAFLIPMTLYPCPSFWLDVMRPMPISPPSPSTPFPIQPPQGPEG